MNYNSRLVNSYSERELKDLLENPSKYQSIIINKSNRSSVECKTSDLAIIDALDNYIVKMMNTRPHELNKNAVLAYRDFLYNQCRNNRMIALDSILFKKGNIDLLFSSEQVKNISTLKVSVTKKCNLELQSLLNKPNQRVSDELLRFAQVQIGNENEKVVNFLDNLYKYLLNKQNENNNYYAREFLVRYTAYMTAKKLNIPPVEVYLSNYGVDGKQLRPGNLGASCGNTSIIYISKDYALDKKTYDDSLPNFVNLIQTVTHEVKHSQQAYQAHNNFLTIDAFNYIRKKLFNDYLQYSDNNEYNLNYLHNEIENDSNYFGWRQTESIIKKYVPSLETAIKRVVSNSIVTSFQTSTATKIIEENKKRRRLPKDKFNVDNMDLIVKNHPEVLNKYPQLRKIYHSNGQKRTFIERLQIETNATGDEKTNLEKIYSEFNSRDFHEGVVQKIDINSLDVNTQFSFFNKIFDMAFNECKHFKDGIKVYGSYSDSEKLREKEFMRISVYRSERIVKYVDYINANKDLIMRLDAINNSRPLGEARPFMMFLDFFNMELKSVQRYIEKFRSSYSNDEEKAAMLAELSSIEKSEVFINGTKK